ncbi:MAG: hypothetical protein HY905_16015 [Deltaproteobacteria bacterium]|nr:hypothetical protein [Deltaproteobacteria bacterium]
MQTRRWVGGFLLAVAAAGCGGVVAGSGDAAAGEVAEAGDGVLDADGDARDDGRDEGGGGDGEAEVSPGCRNGVVESGEECDDGNDRVGDGCEPDCTWTCESAAECADGERCNGDESCVEHVCLPGTALGDGHACETAEGLPGSCAGGACRASVCGNTLVEPGEECDDGNSVAGDGCEGDCTWSCTGNADCLDEDVCNGTESCPLETHACVRTGPPVGVACRTSDGADGVCRGGLCVIPTCGDGNPDPGEECDDGNTSNTDACLNDCRLAECGDGFVWSGEEECDGADVPCTTDCDSAGLRVCTSCTLADACRPPVEVCNGVDDDCDDACDDGFGCCLGTVATGTVGLCGYSQACGAGCIPGHRDFGAVPANDTCAGATRITLATGGSATLTGSTCAAADDVAPPTACAALDGPDVVFALSLTTTKFVVVDTDGSAFDTVLELRGGDATATCAAAPSLACNDNRAAGGVSSSMVSALLTPGNYWVFLDGYNGAAGNYTVHVYTSDPPPNDTCATATVLTSSTTPATVWGTTAGATDDGTATCGSWPAAGPDVWYSLTIGPARHLVYLDLLDLATFSGSIRVYDSCTADVPVACAGGPACGVDRPQWIGVLGRDGAGSTYFIAVDGATAADNGAFSLRHQMAGPTCVDGTVLAVPGTAFGTLPAGAGRSIGSCGGNGNDIMYVLGLCPGRSIAASTCNAATTLEHVLYARRNGCDAVTGGIEMSCSSASSGACTYPLGRTLTFGSGQPAGMYFLFVDGTSVTGGGAYQLGVAMP